MTFLLLSLMMKINGENYTRFTAIPQGRIFSSIFMSEAVAKHPLHVDAFVSNASDKDGFHHIDAIETIASTGFATASSESTG